MIDEDVSETMRSHQEEMDAFDAALYPKPWEKGELIKYIWTLHNTRYRDAGKWARSFRMSASTLRECIAEDMAARRYVPDVTRLGRAVPYMLFGIECVMDETIPNNVVILDH